MEHVDFVQPQAVAPQFNRIYQGDALTVLRSWPSAFCDVCITDPPYNITRKQKGLKWAFSSHVTVNETWDRFSPAEYQEFTRSWIKEITRVCKKNANIVIFGSYHNIYQIGAIASEFDLRVINSLIWIKPNAQPNITCRMFTESTEQGIWLCNNSNAKATNWTFNYAEMKELNGGKQMRNYIEIPVAPKKERTYGQHPTQKPLRLMELLVKALSNKGDLVVDCFAGSGSTLVACSKLERNWIGIEREPKFCELSTSRINALAMDNQSLRQD